MTGKNSAVHSGVINKKALGLTKLANGSIVLSAKVGKDQNKPSKSVAKTTFKPTKGARAVTAAVSKAVTGYREDLRHAAVYRASALARASKPKKVYAEKPARK